MILGEMNFSAPPEMAGCKVASSNVWTAFRTTPARVFLGIQTLRSGAKQYSRVPSSLRNLDIVTIIFPVLVAETSPVILYTQARGPIFQKNSAGLLLRGIKTVG